MQRRLRVCRLLPPRKCFGAHSSSSTLRPARRAVSAAHNAAFPPPKISTSYVRELSVAIGMPSHDMVFLGAGIGQPPEWGFASAGGARTSRVRAGATGGAAGYNRGFLPIAPGSTADVDAMASRLGHARPGRALVGGARGHPGGVERR